MDYHATVGYYGVRNRAVRVQVGPVRGGIGALVQSSATLTNARDKIGLKSSDSSASMRFQLFIRSLTGHAYSVDCVRDDTIGDLVAKLYGNPSFVNDFDDAGVIHLIVGGEKLDPKRTVAHYNLQRVATIHVVSSDDWHRPWPLRLVNMDGSAWGTVDVTYEEKIGSVLSKVWNEENRRTGALEVSLFLDGVQMDYHATVGYYGVRNRAVQVQVGR